MGTQQRTGGGDLGPELEKSNLAGSVLLPYLVTPTARPRGEGQSACSSIGLLLLRCQDRCDALCGLRPTSRDARHHLVDQPARLGQHLLIATRRRAKDEFGHPASDIGGDALDNHFGIADRKIALRIAPGTSAVSLEKPLETGVVVSAKAVRDAGAVMVAINLASFRRGRGPYRWDDR